MENENTRTLLFGIFVVTSLELTAPEVIALAEPLGISATNVKSHLTRMVADGALERRGPRRHARYMASSRQAHLVRAISDRLHATGARGWDGNWYALSIPMPSDRRERERLRTELWFDGFRPSPGGAFLRPAWPQPWAENRLRAYLAHSGAIGIRGVPVDAHPLPAGDLYELDDLDREAHRLARTTKRATRSNQTDGHAFAMRLTIGGRVARLVGHDPRLPAAIWGARTGMDELKKIFADFDARLAPLSARFVARVLGDGLAARSGRLGRSGGAARGRRATSPTMSPLTDG